jgi:dihydrofolate reductase
VSAIPLVAVVAVARNGVIGRDNRLLWRLKSDLRRFRSLTLGKPLIMGRKTFLSIGKALPGRHCIVVTRDSAFSAADIEAVNSLDAALEAGSRAARGLGASEIMIGGGGEIYAELLPQCAKAHVTLVETECDGDATFPWPMPKGWQEMKREAHPADHDNEFAYSFVDFVRRER